MSISIAAWIATALLLYNIILVVYRLYFHPLAKFPGPRLAAISRWYEFWYDVLSKGRYAYEVERMHEVYGPIVRVTPREVHINDPTWSRVILAGPGHIRDKDPSLASAVGSPFGTFGTSAHAIHKRRRVPIAGFFAKRPVETSLQPTIWEGAEALCETLRHAHARDEVIEGQLTFLAWATDSLTACAFGEKLGLLQDPRMARKHLDVFEAFAALYPLLKQCSWIIPTALKLPALPFRLLFPPLATLLDVHVEMGVLAKRVCSEASTAKMYLNGSYKSIFQSILSSDMPGDEKTADRISHEGLEILLAGGYTTVKAISLVTFFVLADPKLEAALRQDLREVMPDPKEHVDLKILQELTLMSAIFKEALRVGFIVNHRLTLIATNEVLRYGDWIIPPGTRISTTPAANGLDPAFFPDPHRFDPYRWIDSDAESLHEMNKINLPFATGSRGCLGMHFAYAELYIAIACMFRRFRLELYDTVRERDIDGKWTHLVSEPTHGSHGVRFKVTGVVDS